MTKTGRSNTEVGTNWWGCCCDKPNHKVYRSLELVCRGNGEKFGLGDLYSVQRELMVTLVGAQQNAGRNSGRTVLLSLVPLERDVNTWSCRCCSKGAHVMQGDRNGAFRGRNLLLPIFCVSFTLAGTETT